MNVERFVSERRAGWDQLNTLVEHAKGKPERLAPGDAVRMGALYRAAAADLAIARRRFRSEPVVGNLERLVGRARSLVYATAPKRGTLIRFFARDYWVRVIERPGLLLIAAFLLFAPGIIAGIWGWLDPERAAGFLPAMFQGGSQREGRTDLGIGLGDQAAFSSAIFTNNIRVTFLAFALGITAGLGTAFVLLQNGVLLGVVFGLAASNGDGAVVLEYVVAHGVLELSCIVVGAAAGLRIGWAVIDPGRRKRSEVLRVEGRAAVEMVLGTVVWLIVAGLIEGFITPAGFGLLPMLLVGFFFGGLFWALAFWRGRTSEAVAADPA